VRTHFLFFTEAQEEEASKMASIRFILACEDAGFTEVLQEHLTQFLDRPPAARSFESVSRELGPSQESIIVVATSRPRDVAAAHRLIQEIGLHHWPARVLLVLPPELADRREFSELPALVIGRYVWPADVSALSYRLRALGPWKSTPAQTSAEVETVIAHRLEAQTPSLVCLARQLALAAAHDVTVLITGETGTGKTYLAQMIHQCSPRQRHGFLVVPCGALASNLIESELFGHARGAFTGADRAKEGKFRAAGQGTLLLDEIDALGMDQQANLLRVLETGEFEPVGSNETLKCQARMVVASNVDLEDAVRQGRFRQDLYYRLNVMSFHLPALRERVRDIAPLARALAFRFAQKFGKNLLEINPETLAVLTSFPWPGNIRQLENVIQQAVLVCEEAVLQPAHLPLAVRETAVRRSLNGRGTIGSLIQHREARERSVIEQAIVDNEYSRARAAVSLGISRVTLYKKMRKYGLLDMPRRGLDERPLGAGG
jgi:transcriptional regulator with PAS, ATPase and Fis domain